MQWPRPWPVATAPACNPPGAYAANALGLSEQVPAKAVFLTDGPSRTVKIGPTTIQLRRTTASEHGGGRPLKRPVDPGPSRAGQGARDPGADREHLKRTLPADKRRELLKDLKLAPAWMHPIFRELAEEEA